MGEEFVRETKKEKVGEMETKYIATGWRDRLFKVGGGTELIEKLAGSSYLRVGGEVTCRWEEKVEEMLLCFSC